MQASKADLATLEGILAILWEQKSANCLGVWIAATSMRIIKGNEFICIKK